MVGRVRDAMTRIEPGDRVALDGDHGAGVRARRARTSSWPSPTRSPTAPSAAGTMPRLRDQPAVTLDGMRVGLHLNAAFLVDLAALEATGADGIGLYRTELAFMVRDRFPDVAAQSELYAKVRELAGDKPVVFRTLDIGSDKHLPYWQLARRGQPGDGLARDAHGAGPAGDPAHAAAGVDPQRRGGRPLDVMFPMVAEVAEITAARRCWTWSSSGPSSAAGRCRASVRVGAMLEVPSLFWQLRALLPRVDFVSIGSNDLFQFLFACDRGNAELIDRYDVLSPPVLSFLRELVERCRAAGVALSFCGEMASRPLEAMVLLGLGVRSLSVTPADVGPVKTMLRSLRCGQLASYLGQLYDLPDHSVRVRLRHYALDHGVQLHI